MIRILAALSLFLAGTAQAASCPAIDQAAYEAEVAPLFTELADAEDPSTGQQLSDEIWAVWTRAPDAMAQGLLDAGMQQIRWGAYAEAEVFLDQLVAYCPDYTEGWNQRAFARFLQNKFDGALEDLQETLGREPRHFGALAGRGLTLLRQGRQLLAHSALREAVKLHPWLNERHLLPPDEKI